MRDQTPRRLYLAGTIVFAIAVLGCGGRTDRDHYRADSLVVADPRAVGIEPSRIAALVQPFRTDSFGTHTSLLVVKDGQLLVEEYFGDARPNERRAVQSVSKSITSLLTGYVLAQGYIASIDDPIARYLPRYRHLLTGGKEKITVRHLLTMTSGLSWNEWDTPYSDSTNLRTREHNSSDAVAFVLSRPLSIQPGETRVYNGGGMTLLFEVLRNASGLSAEVLVERAFKGLLDRTEIEAMYQRDGRVNAAGGFLMTPRAMAKVGQMVLQHGVWNGDTLFDPKWITESTDAVTGLGDIGYGYLWWRHALMVGDREFEAIVANGIGGQYIVIIPGVDVVIAVTAENYERPIPVEMLIERVLSTLGPFDRSGSVVQSPRVVDSAAAYPPTNAAWREIVSVPNPTNNGALTRIAVDTGAPQHLDDGSYLVWLRTTHERPLSRAGQPYNWQTSRFLLRCETPTDGRHKGVSITGFMNDDPVFQRVVGLATATTQPWVPAWGGSLELIIFRRACSALTAS